MAAEPRTKGTGRTRSGRAARRRRTAVQRPPAQRPALSQTVLVNVNPQETRVAVLEKGELTDFEVEREERLVGGIYKARVMNIVPGMDAAFVDIGLPRNAFLYVGDVTPEALEEDDDEEMPAYFGSIKEALSVGEEIIVQIGRPPVGGKGARVTTRLSLPGRHVVLLARAGQHVGISRKIADLKERSRLRRAALKVCPPEHGLIIRTEAEGKGEAELREEITSLCKQWEGIERKAASTPAPCLLHRDLGLVGRTVRDLFTTQAAELVVDDEEEYNEVVAVVRESAPHAASRVKLHQGDAPLFESFGVEADIARTLERTVPLPSGGYIAFDETEAFMAIDVNSHRFIGKSTLAETILQTNLEAAAEIARQLRLRDIGGIIVIDFIDMERSRDKQKVMRVLEDAVARDRARTRLVHISPLGLVEMTRRRKGRSISQTMLCPCPYCEGRGRVRSAQTVALELVRRLERLARKTREDSFLITVHPEVAALFVGENGEGARQVESKVKRKIFVNVDDQTHLEQVEVAPGAEPQLHRQRNGLPNGFTFTLPVHPQAYPEADPEFLCMANMLVYVADMKTHGGKPLTITNVGRWFATANPAPG